MPGYGPHLCPLPYVRRMAAKRADNGSFNVGLSGNATRLRCQASQGEIYKCDMS